MVKPMKSKYVCIYGDIAAVSLSCVTSKPSFNWDMLAHMVRKIAYLFSFYYACI